MGVVKFILHCTALYCIVIIAMQLGYASNFLKALMRTATAPVRFTYDARASFEVAQGLNLSVAVL